jgi:hypothetical protein
MISLLPVLSYGGNGGFMIARRPGGSSGRRGISVC